MTTDLSARTPARTVSPEPGDTTAYDRHDEHVPAGHIHGDDLGHADHGAHAATDPAQPVTRANRRPSRLPLIVGLLAALLTFLAGSAAVMKQETTYSSSLNVVVVPSTTTQVQDAAALFDTLSRGQIAATAAALYGQSRWHPSTPDVTVQAGTVTPSSLIKVTARGTDPEQARKAVSDTVANASSEINRILAPYQAIAMEKAPSPATPAGLGRSALLAASALAALVAGVLAWAATRALTSRNA